MFQYFYLSINDVHPLQSFADIVQVHDSNHCHRSIKLNVTLNVSLKQLPVKLYVEHLRSKRRLGSIGYLISLRIYYVQHCNNGRGISACLM